MTKLLAEPLIRDVIDFPTQGIIYKDITPIFLQPSAFQEIIDCFVEISNDLAPTVILGIEARGFILASPVALAIGAKFVPVRKAGKLPHDVVTQSYSLEYGTSTLELHRDAITSGDRVLIIDDVLATGGTAAAAATLAEQLGGAVVGFSFLLELGFLGGRSSLGKYHVQSLIQTS